MFAQSKLFQVGRLVVSAGVLVGSSWLITKYLEQRLVSLIIDSTAEALNNPDVQAEVYSVTTKLLLRLLEDPTTKAKALTFVKQAMGTETMEEAMMELTIDTLSHFEIRAETLEVMKRIGSSVVRDRAVVKATHDIAIDLFHALRFVESIKHTQGIYNASSKIPTYDSYKFKRMDVAGLLEDQTDFFNTLSIKRSIPHLLHHQVIKPTHYYLPKLSLPKPPTAYPVLATTLKDFSSHLRPSTQEPVDSDPQEEFVRSANTLY